MATTISINDTLILDQTSGIQDDDGALAADLLALATPFRTALLNLVGSQTLSAGQLAFAASAKGAFSSANYVTVNPDGATINDLFFSDPDGNAFDGDQVIYNGSPLQTVDGDDIYLWSLGDGDIVIATTSASLGLGEVVAAFYLDDAANFLSATIQMVTFIPLDHPDDTNPDDRVDWTDLLNVTASGSLFFDFDALKSGSSLWVAVGSEAGGVLVTGGNPVVDAGTGKKTNASDVIHTSQGGDGTTIGVNNQLFDNAGEKGVFTLVTGLNTITGDDGATGDYVVDPNLNDAKIEGIDYEGYLNVTGAGIYISQSQGSPSTTKDFDINLFTAGSGTTPEEGFGYVSGLVSDTAVNVGSVTVVNDDGEVVGVWGVGGVASGTVLHSSSANGETDVTVLISGNNIDINGVFGEFTVRWTSAGGATFNRFVLTSEAGQFDVGAVEITQGLKITEPVGDSLFVDDDGPAVDLVLNPTAELRLDETDNDADDNDIGGILATNTLAAAAYLTTNSADFGTDGEAGANPTVWSLSLAGANPGGVDSGLDDAVTNNNVMLFVVNSTTIVGRSGGAAGPVVMTISINATTGALTVVQNRAVEHNDPLDHDEAGLSSAMMNSGLVAAVRTITDGDGDSASDNVDVSQVIKLEDDGPAVDLVLDPTAELRLDETDADADDSFIVGGILATNTLAAAAYLTTNTAVFGSDGPAGANPTVWSLSLAGANPAGVDSGLDDAATNANVMLFVVNSTTIVGRSGGAAGPVVMTITINATTGALTVVQERAVEHNDPLDHDEAGLSSAVMNSGLVAAVRTATDGDGDSASDNVDVSQVIKLEDDGPSVDLVLNGAAELRLDETDNDADDNNVGGILATASLAAAAYLTTNTAAFGSDGPAGANPTVWSLSLTGADPAGVDSGLNDTLSGDDVLLFVVNSTTIVGKAGGPAGPVVMTITINATTGALTAVQERAVEHDDPLDHDEAGLSSAVMNSGLIAAVRTATDGDGDSASDSVDISQVIKLEDDGPNVDLELNGSAEVTVDESTLPASDSILASALFLTNTAAFGSDGPGADDSVYKLLLSDDNSGLLDTETGDEVLLSINPAGTLITGIVNDGVSDVTVFTIAVDPDTGEVTLNQLRAMVHGDPGDPDEADTPLTLPNGLVGIERTITDGDDDSDSDNVDISSIFKFEDAGPIQPPAGEDVDNLITDDSFIPDSATETTDDIFPDAPNFGSDGPHATDPITFNLRLDDTNPGDGDDPDSGLIDTATGDAIRFVTVGDDIVGYVDLDGDGVISTGEKILANEAVRYSLVAVDSDTFDVTFTQSRAVFHALAATEETVLANTVFVERHAIDGDGDPAEIVDFDLGEITFLLDDEPTIGPIANSIVDFAAGSSATKTLNGDVNNDPNTSPYSLTSFTPSLVINGVSLEAVSSGDDRVGYWADTNGDTIFGNDGDTEYYRLTLNEAGAGQYTFQVLVDPPPAVLEFNFDTLPSGSNLFGIVGDADAGLIIFGEDIGLKADNTYISNLTQEIKTSQAGLHDTIGIESQMFDPGDAAFFTFVHDPDPNYTGLGLGSTEADDADNILYGSTFENESAFIRIAQLQGNTAPSMSIQLFNIDGSPQGVFMLGARGTNAAGADPDITDVRVYDADDNLIESYSAPVADNGLTIAIVDGVATVTGFGENYKIEWDADEEFDQTLITGVAGKFDIGGFGLSEAQPTPDQMLEFTATVTDGDGDTASASWKIGIDGTGAFDDNLVSGVII